MAITVHFATNRVVADPTDTTSYAATIVAPSDPTALTYGTAFLDDANLTADTIGAVKSIQDISKGGFSQAAIDDLSNPGRNLLVFIHGFDNTFEDALTRSAYNAQWLAASGVAGANTAVVAFSWPSLGKLLAFPIPWADYQRDQTMAGQSGTHLMSFLANLEPLVTSARAQGSKIMLLAHSMGNWALQSAVEHWFSHGNGPAALFDEVVLAAADERFDSFGFPLYGRLSGLDRLTKRISIYYSQVDAVLQLSMAVNLGAQRLGQQGPQHRADQQVFPPDRYRMIDCTGANDYARNFLSSHQYYRSSPSVRADIADLLA